MKQLTSALVVGLLTAGAATAGTIDFQDGNFVASDPGLNGKNAIVERIADGVNFTFTALVNSIGGVGWNGTLGGGAMPNGLHVGGGGNSTVQFSMTADADITLNSYTLADVFGFLGNATMDVLNGATMLSEDNALVPRGATFNFADGPIAMAANTTYTFDINETGFAVQSYIGSFDFTKVTTTMPNDPVVPLPAGLPLLMAGLAAMFGLRARKSA